MRSTKNLRHTHSARMGRTHAAIRKGSLSARIEAIGLMFQGIEIIDLGRIHYEKAWQLQLDFVKKRVKGDAPDLLILCEHEPVYTFGTGSGGVVPGNLPFPAYRVERGGKGTYHGPGQLVLYPIVKLSKPNVTGFLRNFEHWLLSLIQNFNLSPEPRLGETGLWVKNRKIASIGIAVKQWVTFHGAALNVNPDLAHFEAIHPCGYSPSVITSISEELGKKIDVAQVKKMLKTRNGSRNS